MGAPRGFSRHSSTSQGERDSRSPSRTRRREIQPLDGVGPLPVSPNPAVASDERKWDVDVDASMRKPALALSFLMLSKAYRVATGCLPRACEGLDRNFTPLLSQAENNAGSKILRRRP